MTKIVLVRHGEPDYSHVTERGFKGHGRDLAQLTPAGMQQAKIAAMDERVKGATLIVSSPYTRALQTAAILSKELSLDISIEVDMHEWLPDLTFNYISDEEVKVASRECSSCKGNYAEYDRKNWEKLGSVADRSFRAMKKYLVYDKVIVVTHGIVMRQFEYHLQIPYCGIIEVDFHEDFKWSGWVEH